MKCLCLFESERALTVGDTCSLPPPHLPPPMIEAYECYSGSDRKRGKSSSNGDPDTALRAGDALVRSSSKSGGGSSRQKGASGFERYDPMAEVRITFMFCMV